MKPLKFLTAMFFVALFASSCVDKTEKMSENQRSPEFDIEPSCDPSEYFRRDWVLEDKSSIFLSVYCFPVEANDSTYLMEWDPESLRATKMDREFVFPDQTGNAGKVLMTDGTNTYWGDLPTP